MSVYGVEVRPLVGAMIPMRWHFPESRWVEYEPSDERWARHFGYGREVEVPTAYQVRELRFTGDIRGQLVIYASPSVIDAIRAQVPTAL